jgi:hypothetical protein
MRTTRPPSSAPPSRTDSPTIVFAVGFFWFRSADLLGILAGFGGRGIGGGHGGLLAAEPVTGDEDSRHMTASVRPDLCRPIVLGGRKPSYA